MTCTGFAFVVAFLSCEPAAAPQVEAARFCRTAEPIRYSARDTAETRRQVRAHNARGVAICGWGRH